MWRSIKGSEEHMVQIIPEKEMKTITQRREEIKKKRSEYWDKFVSNLTLHGFIQFHEAKGIRKILWGTILLTIVCCICAITYDVFKAEKRYEQNMATDIHYADEIDFPSVTACNFNPVYSKYLLEKFPLNITEQNFISFYHNVLSSWNDKKVCELNSSVSDSIIKGLKNWNYTTYQEILPLFEISDMDHILGHTEELFGHSCKYNGENCKEDDFKSVYRLSWPSLCKTFNHYSAKKAGKLTNTTDVESSLMMQWDISGIQYYDMHGLSGLHVEIHPYGTPNLMRGYKDVVSLEPGVFTRISIEKVIKKYMPPPYAPSCSKKPFKVVISYPMDHGYQYTKAMCKVDCTLQKQLEICGCVADVFQDQVVEGTKICGVKKMKCVFGISEALCRECFSSCPVECDAVEYWITTSRLNLGTDRTYKKMAKLPRWRNKSRQDMEKYVKENIVGFSVGFKTLDVIVMQHKAASRFLDRLGQLGGNMGLLIGFSIVTMFEFLFFIFDYIYCAWSFCSGTEA